ncbi:MAG: gliding motility-associated peptidyl-prolyl isomerase GldI [Flavobacteriaceae bacterium]|nr:MAG: gliding motility-associated peptidyl-prolyl isomerase GldI [Flavobacteriaceae bacterium]
MRYSFFFMVFYMALTSCKGPQARRPVTVKTSTVLTNTVRQTKIINAVEEQKVQHYIKQDSLHTYLVSEHGFWYTYDKKKDGNLYSPDPDDEVLISYEIRDLNNDIIYSEEELGNKLYKVDKEEFITALQIGIKMMKEGETVTFAIPSYNAYGIIGDGDRIGINQSIIITVTLLKINQINKK